MFTWPDPYNTAAMCIFAVLFFAIPALGYVFMVIDFRAYLRSLRRGLMRVYTIAFTDPDWARSRAVIPPCLIAFGLDLPCTEEKLKQAYFERVKLLHPDRGGDKRKFLRLQARFEEALALIRRETNPHQHKPDSPAAVVPTPSTLREADEPLLAPHRVPVRTLLPRSA